MKPETKKFLITLGVLVGLFLGGKFAWDTVRRPQVEKYQSDIYKVLTTIDDDPEGVRLYCESKQRDAGLFDWEARAAREELLDEMKSYGSR